MQMLAYWWDAIYDAAHGFAVALAISGHPKESTEGGHDLPMANLCNWFGSDRSSRLDGHWLSGSVKNHLSSYLCEKDLCLFIEHGSR